MNAPVRSRRGLAATALVLAACSSSGPDGGVVGEDAWTRPSPPGAEDASIYLTLRNDTERDEMVLGGTSERCGNVHIHLTTTDEAGVSSMTGAETMQVAAGGSLTLAPLGLHLMCVRLVRPFELGETFPLTVELTGATVDVVVTVADR